MRSEPFEPIANPGFYVPRPACELALDSLHSALRGGAHAVALTGPAGAGKRMLLRVLEQRLRRNFLPVAVGRCALSIGELGQQVLRGLSQEGPGPAERELLAAALRSEAEGCPLVLLLEQASALPLETAQSLGALLLEGEGALRCVVRLDDESGLEAAHALSPTLVEIGLRAPMSEAESIRFVREHLDRSRASDAVRLRFNDELIVRLHRAAGGVPGALSDLAARIAAGERPPDSSPAPEPAPARANADPFGPSAATGAYQPRPATEHLLEQLTAGLSRGRRTLLLHGPPGLGKTTLLRVLGERLRHPFQPIDIPYGRFDPDDFWSYVLFQLGAQRGDVPESSVVEVIQSLERRGDVLVLLVDEAQSLPESTRARLAAVLHHSEGWLRAVLAVGAEADRDAFRALPDSEWFGLEESLSPEEAAAYVEGRLERFDAPPSVRERFDEGTLSTLFRASRGVPRELNRLAGAIERADAVSADRAPAPAIAADAPPPGGPIREASAVVPTSLETADVAPSPADAAESEHEDMAAEAATKDAPEPLNGVELADSGESPPRPPTDGPAATRVPQPAPPAPPIAPDRPVLPTAELERIAEVQAAESARRQLSAPPVARAEAIEDATPEAPALSAPRSARERRRSPATGFLPHLALAAGVPATLVVLWLWLSPVFLPEVAAPPQVAPVLEEVHVHINATPWARVHVDGRPLGITPLGNIPLARGPHDFRAELPDGRIFERRVDVSETRRHIAFP